MLHALLHTVTESDILKYFELATLVVFEPPQGNFLYLYFLRTYLYADYAVYNMNIKTPSWGKQSILNLKTCILYETSSIYQHHPCFILTIL